MFTVNVVNRDTYQGGGDIYVGRPTILGNPFSVKQHGRDKALKRYTLWINTQYRSNNQAIIQELEHLTSRLIEQGEITLSCWCHPKPCHADLLAKAIIRLATKQQEKDNEVST
jgi:hypothetical protein